MDIDARLRAWWWVRQGLDGSLADRSPAEVLERTGWSRSVGGSGPYLALHARAGLARERVDADVAKLAIQELPAARGCTYVVPAADFGLALRAGQGRGDAAAIATAKKHLGVTDKELDRLCRAVLDALGGKELDPRELKDVIGDAVRSLGAEGKKRGQTTTLPLALGKLQSGGRIRRVPIGGRLDQQRYRYTAWRSPPVCKLSDAEVDVELARRFFRWIGPASTTQLAWWAGLGVKAARAAVAQLGLVPFADGDERVLFAEDLAALRAFQPPRDVQLALVGSLDNLSHLRRDVAGLVDVKDAKTRVLADRGRLELGLLSDLPHHAILDRGRVIGFWEFDPGAQELVWGVFGKPPAGLAGAIERTEAFVRDQLGDARTFSLDSPDSRGERLAAVKQLG